MYAVQNPFLYGMYELRREQMKMQQESLEANLKTGTKVRFSKFYQVRSRSARRSAKGSAKDAARKP